MSDLIIQVQHGVGFITLNRPKALNALSLAMIRDLSDVLLQWREDEQVQAVAIRGSNKEGPFGGFCAGGDIRFFHQAALAGDPALEDFFTEEYTLNHLIHHYPKPYLAFMDGIVMGGGMGISQGAALRIVTERTQMAMPETNIGLFPDVGGGYFLSRCPGRVGEYLALTGQVIRGADAIAVGLADVLAGGADLEGLWNLLGDATAGDVSARMAQLRQRTLAATQQAQAGRPSWRHDLLDDCFGQPDIRTIVGSLEAHPDEWCQQTARQLRQRSALMLHVVLEQLRRGRTLSLADDLRLERDLVRHCFQTRHLSRSGASSETVEGIRALAIDKDHQPRWNPSRIEDVTTEMVQAFFVSPWPAAVHPLRDLD